MPLNKGGHQRAKPHHADYVLKPRGDEKQTKIQDFLVLHNDLRQNIIDIMKMVFFTFSS